MADAELSAEDAARACDLFTLCENLKARLLSRAGVSNALAHFAKRSLRFLPSQQRTPRAGWVRHQVASPESVADHSFRIVRPRVCRRPQTLSMPAAFSPSSTPSLRR